MPKVILVTTAGRSDPKQHVFSHSAKCPCVCWCGTPRRAEAMANAGVEIAVGDLEIPESINQAMAGVTSVVLVSPAVPAQELNVIASAARAGIEPSSRRRARPRRTRPSPDGAGRPRSRPDSRLLGCPIRCCDRSLHAEHVDVGTGDRQDEQLRFLGSRQGPCRHGRRPRRRRSRSRDRRFTGPARKEDLLAECGPS